MVLDLVIHSPLQPTPETQLFSHYLYSTLLIRDSAQRGHVLTIHTYLILKTPMQWKMASLNPMSEIGAGVRNSTHVFVINCLPTSGTAAAHLTGFCTAALLLNRVTEGQQWSSRETMRGGRSHGVTDGFCLHLFRKHVSVQ